MAVILTILFSLSYVWIGVIGTGSKTLFLWPGIFGLSVVALVLLWKCRKAVRSASRGCLFLFGLTFLYFLVRALTSPVAFSARQDLILLGLVLITYVFFATAATSLKSRKIFVWTLLLLLIGNGAVAFYQYVSDPTFHIRPGYTRSDGKLGVNPSGFFSAHAHMGGFVEMVVMFAMSALLLGRPGRILRVIYFFLSVLGVALVVISGSRGAFMAFGCGFLLFCVIGIRGLIQKYPQRGGLIKGSALTLALVFAVPVALIGIQQIEKRWEASDTAGNERRTFSLIDDIRTSNWKAGFAQWEEAPLLGTGSRTYNHYSIKYWPETGGHFVARPVFAHNDYLQTLAEYGVLGLGILVLCLIFHLGRGVGFVFGSAKSGIGVGSERYALLVGAVCALTAQLIHGFVDFNMHLVVNAIPIAFCLAVITNPWQQRQPSGEKASSRALFEGPVLKFTAGVAGICLLVKGVTLSRADYYAEKLERAVLAGEYSEALAAADKTLALDPLNDVAYRQLGYTRIQFGASLGVPVLERSFSVKAAEALLEAVALNPLDYISWMWLGVSQAGAGQSVESVFSFRKAMEAAPGIPAPFVKAAQARIDEIVPLIDPINIDKAIEGLESELAILENAREAHKSLDFNGSGVIKYEIEFHELLYVAYGIQGNLRVAQAKNLQENEEEFKSIDRLREAIGSFENALRHYSQQTARNQTEEAKMIKDVRELLIEMGG